MGDHCVLADQIRQTGGIVVLDATDGGQRTCPAPLDPQLLADDPVRALARAYLAIPSIHHRPNVGFFSWLREQTARQRVQGLILRRYVWCDLWHAEAARLSAEIAVPVVDLEIETESAGATARLLNRLASFVEMLQRSSALRQSARTTCALCAKAPI